MLSAEGAKTKSCRLTEFSCSERKRALRTEAITKNARGYSEQGRILRTREVGHG